MKLIFAALFMIFVSAPAMAFELYHCTVNDVTDGYFSSLYLKVDGEKVTGSTIVQGVEREIGENPFVYRFTGHDGKKQTAIMYQEPGKLTEAVAFNLQEVTGKLGQALRYTANRSGETEKKVDMICDMAPPI